MIVVYYDAFGVVAGVHDLQDILEGEKGIQDIKSK